ncbi:MAG TPA: alpha/beta hydrolase [Pseudolabrys sp.]|nr:alpha/beta hydrolase [Pseudolabrys sp.]
MVSEPASIFLSAPDGLRLHVRRYGRPSSQALPVLCLPGLARTAADFETLAHALSADPKHSRPVFALDYRGRGQSDYDRDVSHYSFQTELADIMAVIAALECQPAVIVGTSRGGILAMLLAAARPSSIAGVVLNDIGPVIEPQGLMRIKGYVGKLPQPRNFEEGAEILRRLFSGQFPKLGHDDWLAASKRTFKQADDALVPTYDVRLAETLAGFEPEQHLPALWKEFDALAQRPLMVIRGANSDLLSPLTVTAMRARRAEMDAIEVPDQGHAPLLAEPDIIGRISAFAAGCDAAH